MRHWLVIWAASALAAAALSVSARLRRRRRGAMPSDLDAETLFTTMPIVLAVAGALTLLGGWDRQARGVVLGALVLTVAGALQRRVSPRVRLPLLAMVAAAAGAVAFGIRIDLILIPVLRSSVVFGRLAAPLSVAWLFAIGAAFYTTGRLEGLPLPMAAVAGSIFFIIIALQPQTPTLARVLSASAGGASAGLLALALSGLRPPARGATAMVCGYLLAVTAVVGTSKSSALLTLGVPLILFALPLISMTTIVFDRLRQGLVVMEVRQDIYSVLLARGLPRHKAIILVTLAEAYLGVAAVLLAMMRTRPPADKLAILGLMALIGVPAFGRLLAVLVRTPAPPEAATEPRLLDMKVDPVGMSEALTRIETFIRSRRPHHIVTSDTPALARAIGDPAFRDVVNAAHMVTADGVGVVWAARVLGVPIRERVPGIDLMEELCRLAAQNGYRVFFLGGKPGVAEQAAQRLAGRYSGLPVVGVHHGHFSKEEEPAVLDRIRRAAPDILFVALGSPRQDHWINQHKDALRVPVCIGVGGSFDVFAGELRRAPLWMRRFGLEWIYRAVQEPWRVRRWTGIPKVIAFALKKRLRSYWS